MSEKFSEKIDLQGWILGLGNHQFLHHLNNCEKCSKKWNNILICMLKKIHEK